MYYSNDYDYNECIGRGMCSIAPNISSYQEIMLILLRSIAFYIINCEKIGLNFEKLKVDVVKRIANLIATNEYTDEQLLNVIIQHYKDYIFIKREYIKECKAKDITKKDLAKVLKLTPNMVLSDILALGHKLLANKKMDSLQKCYYELLFVMLKSVSLSLVKLYDYNITDKTALDKIIEGINLYNYSRFPLKKIQKSIIELAKTDKILWELRQQAQENTFGKSSKTHVSLSTTPGKAILVSGSNLFDLYNLLETSKDIPVYSHGDLLIAHTFEKFKKFKNFKGHFGTYNDNYILDYATFPGAVLITKHATQNIEFLIRGRLFTTAEIPQKGVIKIDTNNFSQVMDAAQKSKGFSKGRKKEGLEVGFDIEEFSKRIDSINLENNPYIFVIGISNYSTQQADYFDNLLKQIPANSHLISFSYPYKDAINIANNFPLQLTALEILFKKIPATYDNLVFFITKCDPNTISGMINLKISGAKNIFISDCKPNVINPTVMTTFIKLYGLNQMTHPTKDLEKIINKKEPA